MCSCTPGLIRPTVVVSAFSRHTLSISIFKILYFILGSVTSLFKLNLEYFSTNQTFLYTQGKHVHNVWQFAKTLKNK